MKAQNIEELNLVIELCCLKLDGCVLQEIRCSETYLALGLFLSNQVLRESLEFEKIGNSIRSYQKMYWLIFDFDPKVPSIFLLPDNFDIREIPGLNIKKVKPIGLFLAAHAKGLFFRSMELVQNLGRVIELKLIDDLLSDKPFTLQFILVPHFANLIATASGSEASKIQNKQISWSKPRELPKFIETSAYQTTRQEDLPILNGEISKAPVRTLQEFFDEWIGSKDSKQIEKTAGPELQRAKDLEKKKRALIQIQKNLEANDSHYWMKLGEDFKALGSLDNAKGNFDFWTEFGKWIEEAKTFSWNLEKIFQKARKFRDKEQGTRARIEILKRDIERLESSEYNGPLKKGVGEGFKRGGGTSAGVNSKGPAAHQMGSTQNELRLKGTNVRKKELSDNIIAYLGKSAADNLKLLRQAKSWDIWLHLADYPGSHAIIHKNHKQQKVPEGVLREVAQWLVKESLGTKGLGAASVYNVLHAEVRFVHPIKGDKLGRVSVHETNKLKVQF